MAIDLGLGIDTKVTPSLHPQVVASLDDFDDDTSGHLQQVVEAFTLAYTGVSKVHAAREAAASDGSMTEVAIVLRTADAADRTFKDAAARFDKVTANMKTGCAALERELTQPLETRTAHPLSVEVRAFIRELKDTGESPLNFVRNAIETGESEVVSAALGAPAFLSGLTPEMQAVLLRMHHEKSNPQAAKRLRAMKGALDLIYANSGYLHSELEKAIGVEPWKVREYRAAKHRTDKAFAS